MSLSGGRPAVHYGENRGDGETEMVMFYAGTEGVPLSESADL